MTIRGKSYVTSAPAFSNDGKKLLICTANSVFVYSTTTGLQVTSLEGHTALVTAVVVEPSRNQASKILCHCWTASLDGTIRYWDFSLSELVRSIDIQKSIYSMVIPFLADVQVEENEKLPNLFAYVSVEYSIPKEGSEVRHREIRKCNLTKGRLVPKVLTETKRPEVITISPSGNFLGILNKNKLDIWKVPDTDSDKAVMKKMALHHTKSMTILAFHPTQRIVAAGDVTGRILMWRGFGNRKLVKGGLPDERLMAYEEERPGVRDDDDAESCSTWHWHQDKVKLLSFSSDGAYVYSGGSEGVLVVWQLDTGKKKYLPRIGSPLLYFLLSPDPSLSSISCADNQIHILKMPSMEVLVTLSGIKPPFSCPKICKSTVSGTAFDSTTGLVAVSTENYCVQLYSLFDDRIISEVQVCERNHQPGDAVTVNRIISAMACLLSLNSQVGVTLVALSLDGSVMATAEGRHDEEGIGGLVCLKFWRSKSQEKVFMLSTIVYEPHRDAGISALAFHPSGLMAVSASSGGDFKVWTCSMDNTQKEQMLGNSSWTCHAVGSYKKKPMTAAAFSSDGSVLAVAAETIITLWNPLMNTLLTVIGETLWPVKALSFVGKSDYLVATSHGSEPLLSVWSMSKLSISWSYKFQVEAVACSAYISSFGVLVLPESSKGTEDGVILLFNVEDPVPVAIWSAKKAKQGALAFVQVNPSSSEGIDVNDKPPKAVLVYMNSDHEFVLFDPDSKEVFEVGITPKEGLVTYEDAGHFGYASIYGELPKTELKRRDLPLAQPLSMERPWETIFSGSSHNLPPLSKLCSTFLESLLEKRASAGV